MASCKCKEMLPYTRDVEKLSGPIPKSISKADSDKEGAASALEQASAGVEEALGFNMSAFKIVTSLRTVILPLLAAIVGAAGASSAESARLAGILSELQTEDTTYHNQQAALAAAKKRLAASKNTDSSSTSASSKSSGLNRNVIM